MKNLKITQFQIFGDIEVHWKCPKCGDSNMTYLMIHSAEVNISCDKCGFQYEWKSQDKNLIDHIQKLIESKFTESKEKASYYSDQYKDGDE